MEPPQEVVIEIPERRNSALSTITEESSTEESIQDMVSNEDQTQEQEEDIDEPRRQRPECITVMRGPQEAMAKRPKCEKTSNFLIRLSFVSCVRHKNRFVRWLAPGLSLTILTAASTSLAWYPDYFLNQPILWTIDLCIGVITYIYMLTLQNKWYLASLFETTPLSNRHYGITLFFYCIYMLYDFYFTAVVLYEHREKNVYYQIANVVMALGWYIYFAVISALYYFICMKLLQRSEGIRLWLKEVVDTHQSIEDFYDGYNYQYKKTKHFAKYWNFLVLLGMILLTFHIPIELFSIFYEHVYYDIPGTILKIASLGWYIYSICALNDRETFVMTYLYKHRMYSVEDMNMIEKYTMYRPLGLNFYGIKINTGFMTKIVLVVLNLIVPTIYALIKNNIIH